MQVEIMIVPHPCPECGAMTKFMQPREDKRCAKCSLFDPPKRRP